jgi:quercetin dioxygenase-like cupin family protein
MPFAAALMILALGQMAQTATVAPDPAAPPATPGITRTDLQEHDLSVSGWETIQTRVDLAPGATAPKHMHPGEEIIYVLKGTLEYHLLGQPVARLKAGDVLFIPYGKPHSVVNVGLEPASELATYVVEKGKPLVVPVR